MSECTVSDLNEKLKTGGIQLFDVRESAEFGGGRVANSKLLPLGEIEKRSGEIDRTKPVFLICRTGNRSGQAQAKLKNLGFENVTNVAGGCEAWKKAGLPLESDANAPWALDRQVRLVAGSLVLTGFLLSFIHPYFIALSAFIGAGLTFSALTDTCAMGMMLLKMPWNRRQLKTSGQN